MDIQLASEALFNIGSLPITNTLVTSLMTTLLLSVVAIFATRTMRLAPMGLQNAAEMVIDGGFTALEELAPGKANVIFPFVATFFFFIVTANWLGLLPGMGTLGIWRHGEFVPLLRAATSDLNTTLGLALISAIATHAFALRSLGIRDYFGKWVSLNPVFLFVGILELVSEVTKVLSLSFRLFGNIFAGEVVLGTISKFLAFVVPLPFLGLELVVGLVQGLVFTILTAVFMIILSEKEHT